jgi:hypothetical protein
MEYPANISINTDTIGLVNFLERTSVPIDHMEIQALSTQYWGVCVNATQDSTITLQLV